MFPSACIPFLWVLDGSILLMVARLFPLVMLMAFLFRTSTMGEVPSSVPEEEEVLEDLMLLTGLV